MLALANPRDQYHHRAVAALENARAEGVTWVSTILVLAELHGHLIRYLSPVHAREIIRALKTDDTFDWVDVTDQVVRAAIDSWMTRFHDQSISLTDAVTFEVMRRERIAIAFAFDRHFVVAGYRVLPG